MKTLLHGFISWFIGFASCAAVDTSFSAYFNNGSGTNGGDDNASLYQWKAAIGTGGSLDETLTLPNAVGVSQGNGAPLVSGQSTVGGFLFALPDATPGVMLLHTTSMATSTTFQDNPQSSWFRSGPLTLANMTVGGISRLAVHTRAASGSGLEMRFAILVNGVWYASATPFSQADPNSWEQRIVNPASGLWRANVFTSGTMLDDDLSDNSLVALSASDGVSGYGIYADTGTLSGTAARVRIDSFEVVASNVTANDALVSYAGGAGIEEFKDVVELSDGTVLVAGTAENLNWVASPKTQLAPLGIPNRNTGRTAFLMRLAPDLQSALGVWHLPAGQSLDFRWIKTTNRPGAPTGSIYLSGQCDSSSGDYFIAKLNSNFVNGAPSGFSWIKTARASGTYGSNLGLQPWDVGGDGRVAYVDELGTIRVYFLDANGAPLKLDGLRGSHWATGVSMDDANRQEGIGSELPTTTASGISFPADLRSWTEADRLAVLPDGNGSIKRGTWPMDLFFPVQDRTGGTSGTIEYGYTGYRSVSKYRIGGIAFNRDNNDFSIGFNIQSRFWDASANIEQPDFEPAVISYAANGALKWWSRLYAEVVDANNNGVINSGETRTSSPDQYVDGLAVDHSTAPPSLVVNARCHGNNVSNLWSGNKVVANPGGVGFQNSFTGTEGNIHISWIGKIRENDGTLQRATYLAGYFRDVALTQAVYSEPIHDGWPSHNAGWPNLTTTRAEPGSIRVDASGQVYVVGLGPRMVTTSNAYQKLPKITGTVNEGTSPWAQFARVFNPDLSGLAYSSALTGAWTYPSAGAQPVGADNTDLYGIFPGATGLLTVGRQRATSGVPTGNAVPLSNVPTWGNATPANVSALFARLPFATSLPSPTAPKISAGPVATPAPVTGTTTTLSVTATDLDDPESSLIYSWELASGPSGGSVAFSENDSNLAKSTSVTFTRAGFHGFRITVTDPANQSVQVNFGVTVNATPNLLTVSPGNASIDNGTSLAFSASGTDQFGQALAGQTATWEVSGGGVIDNNGVFHAQVAGGPYTVTASMGALTESVGIVVNYVPIPEIDLSNGSIVQDVQIGSATTRPLRIDNLGSATLEWDVTPSVEGISSGESITTFETSNSPGGPAYSWIDISSGSTTVFAPSGTSTVDDASKAIDFPAGFSFPHYGNSYNSVNVCSNGFLTFGNSSTNYLNQSLPATNAPGNLIAMLWTDLMIDSSAWVKWKAVDADHLVITWNNVKPYSGSWRTTFQVVLSRSGEILVQVKSYAGTDLKYTVGIQNLAKTEGVLASYNPASAFIPVSGSASNFAVRFPVPATGPEWLSVAPAFGSVPAPGAGQALLGFDSTDLVEGTYHGSLTVASNDLDEPELVLPVTLNVMSGLPLANAPSGLLAETVSDTVIGLSWNFEGGSPNGQRADYRAQGDPGWASGPVFSASATAGQVTGLLVGTAYEFRLVATNATGDSLPSNVSSASTWSAIEAWRDLHFESIASSGDQADLADPDRDSIVNLLEYSLAGGDPLAASVTILPVASLTRVGGSDYLTLTVMRNPLATGVTHVVETSGNLVDWGHGPGWTELVEDSPGTLIVRDAVPVGAAGQRFIRFKVSRP